MTDVILLTSWMPTEMLRLARDRGLTVALLSVSMPELERRNSQRPAEVSYSDVSHWFESQLDNYADLGALITGFRSGGPMGQQPRRTIPTSQDR